MKAADARKLIGKRIRWVVDLGTFLRPYAQEVVLVEVIGRNARDDQGNWHWLPSIPNAVEVVE